MSFIVEHPAASLQEAGTAAAVEKSPSIRLTMASVSGEEWDAHLAGFDGAVQEQLHVFAAARWPGARHEPLLFSLDGEIIGGTLVMVQPLPLRLASLAVCKWGPVLKDNRRGDAHELYGRMVELLISEYADRRAMMLSIMPRAEANQRNLAHEHLVRRGFKTGPALRFPSRYMVKLKLDDAGMRKSFAQKWRYHLNKSEKAGLTVERAGPERLPEFDALYAAMTDRKKFPDTSAYHTLLPLMQIKDDRLRPELFFTRYEGKIIAGAVIFKAGETAVYLYGATNDLALPLRAGYFMHWHIMRWLRDNTGAQWYDLGGTDGFQGLHQFKKGMVGDAGAIQPVPPVMNFSSRPLPFLLGSAAYGAREAIQRLRHAMERLRTDIAHRDQTTSDKGEAERS